MSETLSRSRPRTAVADAPAQESLHCDFCGDLVMRVRRIVLDGDYERLQTRHVVRYACESCSDEKERTRLGLARANR
jgi:hypothetical protein